jgi:AraC family transcriptional regulator, melibiose operon regulatory protein
MRPGTKSNLFDLPMSDSDEDVLSHEFCIETHLADAMPESHWHDHVEINYLWSGSLSYLINGQRLVLQAGELCIFWAATPHQVIAVEQDQRLSCAYVPLSMFLALPLEPDFRQAILLGGVYFSREKDEGDRHMFARWTREWSTADTPQRHILEAEVHLRVRRLSWSGTLANGDRSVSHPGKAAGRRAVAQAEAMTRFIHDRLESGVTVAAAVAASGLHPTNAHAAFQRVLGMSIGDYIRRQRLRHAMRLLVDTDVEIAQIAFECGYTSTNRLYDAFQKRLGKTPRAYRLEFRSAPQQKAVAKS